MQSKLIRLIRIITLVQAKPGIRAKELAYRCETTERTIYRDLNYLSAAYIPIVSEGHSKGYHYLSHFAVYPLDLTEDETKAFSLLRTVIQELKGYPPGMMDAYDKLMAIAIKKQKRSVTLAKRINELFCVGSDSLPQKSGNYLEDIIQAIIDGRSITATYHTQSRNATTTRTIDPYYLLPREHRFYLIGYCQKVKEIRTFRVSRFQSVTILKQKFDNKDFNINKYLKNTWSIERSDREIRFLVRFNQVVARYILEEELFVKPKIKTLDNGDILFEVVVNSEREFMQWLNQYGANAEIIQPKVCRDKQLQDLQKWIAMYDV